MVDYQINNKFEAVRTDWGAFKEVTGMDEFEQVVVVKLDTEFRPLLGERQSQNIVSRIRLAINRTAREFEVIDEIKYVNVSRTDKSEGEYEVRIAYSTAPNFSEVF